MPAGLTTRAISATARAGSGRKFTLYTTNHLLRDHYPGAIGLKTGYTDGAGNCLVVLAPFVDYLCAALDLEF